MNFKVIKCRAALAGSTPQLCTTCLGERTVQGPAYGSGQSDTLPCPDCSAQPPTEQPRIWRILDRNGVPFATRTTSRATAWHWYRQPDVSGIQYSTDNGKTWIDEQAAREVGLAHRIPALVRYSGAGRKRRLSVREGTH